MTITSNTCILSHVYHMTVLVWLYSVYKYVCFTSHDQLYRLVMWSPIRAQCYMVSEVVRCRKEGPCKASLLAKATVRRLAKADVLMSPDKRQLPRFLRNLSVREGQFYATRQWETTDRLYIRQQILVYGAY